MVEEEKPVSNDAKEEDLEEDIEEDDIFGEAEEKPKKDE